MLAVNLEDRDKILAAKVNLVSHSINVNGIHSCRGDERHLCLHLTDHQQQIIELVCLGMTNGEIAARMTLAESTVKNLLSVIYAKLKVFDRTQLAILAIRAGMVK